MKSPVSESPLRPKAWEKKKTRQGTTGLGPRFEELNIKQQMRHRNKTEVRGKPESQKRTFKKGRHDLL